MKKHPRIGENSSHTSLKEREEQFEQYIISLYESLGFHLKKKIPPAFLIEKEIPGIGRLNLLIECKWNSKAEVLDDDVYKFIRVYNSNEKNLLLNKGVFISDGNFTENIINIAEKLANIEIMKSSQLENQVFDMRGVYRDFVSEYQTDRIYFRYIPLHADIRNYSPSQSKEVRSENIEEALCNWLEKGELGPVFILADYGAGKTTLLQRLKYRYAKAYLEEKNHIKPLFFPLKEFHQYNELDAFLRHCLQRELKRDVPLTLFYNELKNGHFLILLDGFDEMAAQVDKSVREKNFLLLSSLLTSNSMVVLTCRPAYFVTEDEYESAIQQIYELSSPTPGSFKHSRSKTSVSNKGVFNTLLRRLQGALIHRISYNSFEDKYARQIDLIPLNDQQVGGYLQKFNDKYIDLFGYDYQQVKEFLYQIYDLNDLIQRPILLDMINETVLSGQLDLRNHTSLLGPSSLYELYTNMKLDIDWHKGESRRLLPTKIRIKFAIAIALAMFDKGKLELSYNELVDLVSSNEKIFEELRQSLEVVSEEQIASDLQVCTFLNRHQDGLFRFSHKSFMEYFSAFHLRLAVQSKIFDKRFLNVIPKEILYFLGGFAIIEKNIREVLLNWCNNRSELQESTTCKRNVIGAVLYSGREQKRLNLKNAEIFSIDIKKTDFISSKFSNIKFTNITWSNVSLKKITWKDISIINCQISDLSVEESKINFLFRDSNIQDLTVKDSEVYMEGNANLNKVTFTDSNLLLEKGQINLKDNHFKNCTITISYIDRSSLRFLFESCTFSQCTVSITPTHRRHNIEFLNSDFVGCSLFGLQSPKQVFKKLGENNNVGLIIDIDSEEDKINMINNLLLISGDSWKKEEDQKNAIQQLENRINKDLLEKWNSMIK